jgi:Co/Zn/Cd efflux system component
MIKDITHKANIFIKVVINILLLFLIASGGVFIHYGNKIKDKQITKDDDKAGQFMMVLGVMGLFVNVVTSILLGYYWNENSMLERILQIVSILFTLASNVMLIVYGLKIYKNDITEDDYKAGEFIITLGSISVIGGSIAFIYFSGLFNMVTSLVNKKKNA